MRMPRLAVSRFLVVLVTLVAAAAGSQEFPGKPVRLVTGGPGSNGVFAPAKTPVAIVSRLNQDIVRALNLSDLKQQFFSAGVDVVGSSPAQLAAAVRSDMTLLGKLIRDLGLRNE